MTRSGRRLILLELELQEQCPSDECIKVIFATSDGQTEHNVDAQRHPVAGELNLRERLHVHQCDERSSRSALQLDFPLFEYTTGTAEEDELWQPQETRGRKTEDELTTRSGGGMDQVLDVSEGATFISITSHPGALWGVYKILGVPPKSLVVGEMNVLVLRVKKVTE
ncbi:hypothetical protein I350_00579 [Cryptococcus amylolentus CBS 6273]|uniref:Uncharacterized protein n=1 Tax=Cryptococcus amylolentus CBS 6273 TaxID=1296118 RepID=A0A1E3KFK2_9TREE|nr:hypothetical protein I350_00579 [Cryptococcus amylolentus CBS 6273]